MTGLERELAELDSLPLYLTREQTAHVLGVHVATVYRMVVRGDLEARHIGRAVRIPRASVRAWVIRQTEAVVATLIVVLSVVP